MHPRFSIKPDQAKPNQTLCQLINNVKNQIIINTVALAPLKNSVPWGNVAMAANILRAKSVAELSRVAVQRRRRTCLAPKTKKNSKQINRSRHTHTHTLIRSSHTSYARVHILNGIHNELLLTPMCYNYCSNKGAQSISRELDQRMAISKIKK